jgi:hypothetical protein
MTNIFEPTELVYNQTVSEIFTHQTKKERYLFPMECCDNFFEILQGRFRSIEKDNGLEDLDFFDDLPVCESVWKTANILGEYYSDTKSIKYYDQAPEILEITKLHERFHAAHHLAEDQNGSIWSEFPLASSFYKELLAQLFTYIYIRDTNSSLLQDFKKLNEKQPIIYQTYKIFQHYTMQEAERLYWIIRNKASNNGIFMALEYLVQLMSGEHLRLRNAVFNGIRKTINRFREQPFLYFTESDIHASLSRDIMDGHSDIFIMGKELKNRTNVKLPVSLVHHEYPTNFRYESSRLKATGYDEDEFELTKIDGQHGDRGNFDLVVLNPAFVEDLFSQHQGNLMDALKHIINKDNRLAVSRKTNSEELLFAIEVKFIHPFNAGNKDMITEVKKDNNKLHLALRSSGNFIMPINLVFCNSGYIQSNKNSVIDNIKEYLNKQTHDGVCSIFVESYFPDDCKNQTKPAVKKTDPPIFIFNPESVDEDWPNELKKVLGL